MNKKLFVGAVALTVVTVAGIKYYSWIKTKALEFAAGLKGEEWDETLLDTEHDSGEEAKVTGPSVWSQVTKKNEEEDQFHG
jgi:hypothetical protein